MKRIEPPSDDLESADPTPFILIMHLKEGSAKNMQRLFVKSKPLASASVLNSAKVGGPRSTSPLYKDGEIPGGAAG